MSAAFDPCVLRSPNNRLISVATSQKAEAKLAIPEQPFSGGLSSDTLIAARIIHLDHPDPLADVDGTKELITSGQAFASLDWLASPMAEYAKRESTKGQ